MEESQYKHIKSLSGEQPEKIIPVIEEQVVISTKKVEKGSILVDKKVKTEEVSIEVALANESYNIQRIPKNEYLEKVPVTRHEGDTTIIPVVREVMVKKLLLTEEIRITKNVQVSQEAKKINLRKEEITITRKEDGEIS